MTDINDALSLAQHYIRKVIKFCKCLSPFRALPPDDQLLIIKSFFSEMLILQIAFMFKPEWGAFVGVTSEEKSPQRVLINFNLLSKSKKNSDWIYYLLQKCTFAHAELEGDPLLRDLVSYDLYEECFLKFFFQIAAVLLFQQRDGLSCSEYVCYQYWRYYWLGNRYLEQKYADPTKAMLKVKVFLKLKEELTFFKDVLESLFLEDATELPMLLTEVYSKWGKVYLK